MTDVLDFDWQRIRSLHLYSKAIFILFCLIMIYVNNGDGANKVISSKQHFHNMAMLKVFIFLCLTTLASQEFTSFVLIVDQKKHLHFPGQYGRSSRREDRRTAAPNSQKSREWAVDMNSSLTQVPVFSVHRSIKKV